MDRKENVESDVCIGSCAFLTEGQLVEDDALLERALVARDWEVEAVDWRDPELTWTDYDVVLIRSVWNYTEHLEQFLQVLSEIEERHVQLENHLGLVSWNCNKRYILDLAERGVPTVPTRFVESGSSSAVVSEQLHDWASQVDHYVVKPAVGADADGVARANSVDEASRIACDMAVERDVVVQPLLSAVGDEGEYSLMYFGAEFSHAVAKKPAAGEFRVQERLGGSIDRIAPTAEAQRVAEGVLAALDEQPLYARVDLLRDEAGGLVLTELELIEPSLFFGADPEAAERFALLLERWAG